MTHLIFPFAAHGRLLGRMRHVDSFNSMSFLFSKYDKGIIFASNVRGVPKPRLFPVVTFPPCRPPVGCVFHFALRFSQLVIAVPKRWGALSWCEAVYKITETTIDFSHIVTEVMTPETFLSALNLSTSDDTREQGLPPTQSLQRTVLH